MLRCLLAFALFALLLSSGTSALIVDVPENIIIKEGQKQVQISISNDSAEAGQYRVEFLGPVEAGISQSSGEIAAFKTKKVTLSLAAEERLAGQTYESTLVVELGSEREVRKIRLFFRGQAAQGQEVQQGQPGFDLQWLSSGFFPLFNPNSMGSLLSFENILNALLAVVAAILLIAFIARLVKRLAVKR